MSETPWAYRCRFTNWLIAQPWRWHYRSMYRIFRAEQRNPFTGRLYVKAHNPLRAACLALSFPHVHWSEDAEEERSGV